MSRVLNWSEDELSSYYFEREIDLSWLTKSSRHQFRWKSLKGPWITSDRRISSSKKLIELFSNSIPSDVYVSTSSWLNPVNLPRIKDTKKPSPILLDHLVVFDIDIRPFCLVRLEEARKATLDLRNWLIDNTDIQIRHITFSGSKGFHIIAKDPDRESFSEPDPVLREEKVKSQRKRLLNQGILLTRL
jgi:DNA primase catalytic subunit